MVLSSQGRDDLVTALAPAPPLDRSPDLRARAVEAALTCVARHGLAKTTLDDVAREAGCARATLYRYFGGKRQLVAHTVAAEAERIGSSLRQAAAGAHDLEDAIVAVLTTGARELAGHEALAFLLAFEPDLVLPFVTFEGGDRILCDAGAAIAPCFEPFLPAGEAERLGEWVARVGLVYTCPPAGPIDLSDPAAARDLVRHFVLPGFLPITSPSRG